MAGPGSIFRRIFAAAALIAFVCVSFAVRCCAAVLALFKPAPFSFGSFGPQPIAAVDGLPLAPWLQNDIRFDAAHSRRSAARHI